MNTNLAGIKNADQATLDEYSATLLHELESLKAEMRLQVKKEWDARWAAKKFDKDDKDVPAIELAKAKQETIGKRYGIVYRLFEIASAEVMRRAKEGMPAEMR